MGAIFLDFYPLAEKFATGCSYPVGRVWPSFVASGGTGVSPVLAMLDVERRSHGRDGHATVSGHKSWPHPGLRDPGN
jgi:hypothetical protein